MATSPRAVLLLVLGLASLAPALPAQAPSAAKPMKIVDLISLPSVGDPQLSPDGKQLLFVRSDADWKGNRRTGHLWRLDVAAGKAMQLTFGERGESSPRWSPDGRAIAFLARRDPGEDAQTQIYLLPANGGEAARLSKHATSVSDIEWSPDGSYIYFRASDPRSADAKERERVRDDVFAMDENFQQDHLWRITPDGVETRLSSGDYSVQGYDLSHDGKRIVLQRGPNPLLADRDQSEIWIMDADGTNALQLTHNKTGEGEATLSPDGKNVLFGCGCNAAFEPYYQNRLFLMPATGGEAKQLFDTPYQIERARWSEDGKSVLFSASLGVHNELFRGDVASGRLVQLTNGDHSLGSWFLAPSGQQVVSIDDPSNPGDLWLLDANGAHARQLTHVFDTLATRFRLPKQEKIAWKGKDGVTVEGLLYYPLDYKPGTRYPLVVQTHGGPQASDQFGFGRWSNYTQVLAAMGYAVLKPNYRGSTGYGDAFLRDMIGHYYQNAHLDVLAGVDYLVERGIADPERLVAMGWSAGGHMTDKLITFTDRFKAASSGAGASNWISMVAQSDVRTHRYNWFGGSPYTKDAPIDNYWKSSPLSEVWKVKTPTIFLVGASDVRVPMPQSVEMFRGLKFNGVPTKLYVAPREPHGWGELRHELFKVNAELDWFEKYAMGRTYTWEKAPGGAAPAAGAITAAER